MDVLLSNATTSPIDVTSAVPNCSCVESTWPSRPIAPGGNTRATITVTPTESQRGETLRKSVTFVVAGGTPLVVSITGRVAGDGGSAPANPETGSTTNRAAPAATPVTTPATATPPTPGVTPSTPTITRPGTTPPTATPPTATPPATRPPAATPRPPAAIVRPLQFELRVPSVQPGSRVAFPQLDDWIQGTPERDYERGRIYVFEFFGTDCGHCREYAPLIEELAATFGQAGVRFIAITDETRAVVEPWLAKEKEKGGHAYAVACDPDSSAKILLQAGTFRAATPRFFIVKDGVVQWFGHPKDAREPLGAVVAGIWNPESVRAEAVLESQVALAKNFIDGVYKECERTGDWQRALDAIALVRAKLPARAGQYDVQRFGLLIGLSNRPDEGYAFAREIAETYRNDMETTRSIARAILRNGTAVRRDLDLGLELALRADELAKGKDARAADSVALAYFSLGDREKAVAHGERAVQLATDPGERVEFERELAKYRNDPAVPRPVRRVDQGAATPTAPAGG